MLPEYDSWLLRQADEYMRGCEPEIDRDGEYTKCINCLDKCEQYYELFGESDEQTGRYNGIFIYGLQLADLQLDKYIKELQKGE